MLRSNADTATVVDKVRKRDGIKADRSFGKTFRGFSAKLDQQQKRDLLADPNVVALVPDEVVQLTAQTIPTGISRVGGRTNTVAAIDPWKPPLRNQKEQVGTHKPANLIRRKLAVSPIIEKAAPRNGRVGNSRDNAAGRLARTQPFLKCSVHEQFHSKRLMLQFATCFLVPRES